MTCVLVRSLLLVGMLCALSGAPRAAEAQSGQEPRATAVVSNRVRVTLRKNESGDNRRVVGMLLAAGPDSLRGIGNSIWVG